MKKFLLLLSMMIFSLTLTACSESKSIESNKVDETEDVEVEENEEKEDEKGDSVEEPEDSDEEFNEETGEEFIEDFGYVKTVGLGYNEEIGIDGSDDSPLKPIKMGSMELEIKSLHILEIKPEEDARLLLFNDEEEVKAIVVDMKVENKEEIDIEFYPDNAIMITDTGEQIESELGLMGDVGGEFYGKVKKEGQTWWLLNNLDDDIKSVKMIISPPYDMDEWEDLAEEKRLEFDILTYEEALEKDSEKE